MTLLKIWIGIIGDMFLEGLLFNKLTTEVPILIYHRCCAGASLVDDIFDREFVFRLDLTTNRLFGRSYGFTVPSKVK